MIETSETTDEPLPILGLTHDALRGQLTQMGLPPYRAAQIQQWIFQKRVTDFQAMSNIGRAQRDMLAQRFAILTGEMTQHQTATDATEKVLIRWPDGGLTEAVMIPQEDTVAEQEGVASGLRRTACLSTQVGCPVRCAFCASGMEGFKANLTVGQIIEQALRLTALLPTDRRLTNVVFMGMGEPLANFDVVLEAIRILMAPWAFHIGGRKITVSTVGLPTQMRALADAGLPVSLAISLHAPNDALRKEIIPFAKGISIKQIAEAGQYFFAKTHREITLEYIMLDNVNTLPEHARELAAIAGSLRANVNLIYYNEVPELPFARPGGNTMFAFQQALRGFGVNVHIRKSRGRDIAAACGQLARRERSAGA